MEGECPKQKIRGTKNYFLFHAYLLKLPSPLKQCKLHTWFTSDQVVVTQCECETCREVSLSVDGGRPWGREGILAFPCLVRFRSFFLRHFCSLRKGAEEGNFILRVCSPRHGNCIPSVYGTTWVWCVDPQVTSVLTPPLMQRTFTVDGSGVLFLPERLELLQEYPRGKARGGVRWKDQGWGQADGGSGPSLSVVYWPSEAF